jgi:glyceraldehyde-3-phosphate dehydrogenase/erythrose-4-phosphate dehydrogenase
MPLAKVLHEPGIRQGLVNTIHSYTTTRTCWMLNPHEQPARQQVSMIPPAPVRPTNGLVLPEPPVAWTPNVSLVDHLYL